MSAFLEFLSSNETTIAICLIVIIFVLIMTIIIIDIITKGKNVEDNSKDFVESDIDGEKLEANAGEYGMVADSDALNRIDVEAITKNLEKTQEIDEIKYVEEDEELEKTKALLELEILKKELAKMEQENAIKEEITAATNDMKLEESPNENVKDAVKELKVSEAEETMTKKDDAYPMIDERKEPLTEETIEVKVPTMEEAVSAFESAQEENAIISVEELAKASMEITDEEIAAYEDDGNEPISIKELEALYQSAMEPITEIKEELKEEKITFPELNMKVKPANEAYDGKSFKNAPVISPVYGLKPTEDSIMLEQTANLDKLNEEIKKTNEFLSALKELRKNLE